MKKIGTLKNTPSGWIVESEGDSYPLWPNDYLVIKEITADEQTVEFIVQEPYARVLTWVGKKKVIYVDLDGVMADYDAAKIDTTEEERRMKGFFENLLPIEDSIESFKILSRFYDVYFLSTAPWSNLNAPTEKRVWVEKHLGEYAFKRLILTHNKGLLKGDYLIDDRTLNGVTEFEGVHIHFGTKDFPDWLSVLQYLQRADNLGNILIDAIVTK